MFCDTDEQRKILIREVLEFLNDTEVRCTYGAVAGLLGIHQMSVGRYLGKMRPQASWIVNKKTSKPTGYLPEQMHPNLCKNPKIICDAQELRENSEKYQHSKQGPIMTTSNKWSGWLAFPDPEEDGYLFAPFGPGVYELRNR